MKTAFVATIASQAFAFSNSIPIYGTFPGWVDGLGKAKIDVALYFDLLCADCAAENPVINQLLTTPWLGGTVAD